MPVEVQNSVGDLLQTWSNAAVKIQVPLPQLALLPQLVPPMPQWLWSMRVVLAEQGAGIGCGNRVWEYGVRPRPLHTVACLGATLLWAF